MANIVQQYGNHNAVGFIVGNINALKAQGFYSLAGKVHSTQRMVKARMVRARIHKVRHAQLLDAAQALVVAVLYQGKYQIVRYLYKPVNRVVYDFILFQLCKGK